ncbi:hypothetical protein F8M41_024553 [Gigaspora margarita]|uniref:Uncharacterized protein n=1 Tax=Gigaspora margarita TaxID=4874 RepID=A0A8H4ETF3_GIGMA|nr:hypothetical protein F8M41_024553 [Gigaspora margarita]
MLNRKSSWSGLSYRAASVRSSRTRLMPQAYDSEFVREFYAWVDINDQTKFHTVYVKKEKLVRRSRTIRHTLNKKLYIEKYGN